jgi:hypothetical protein
MDRGTFQHRSIGQLIRDGDREAVTLVSGDERAGKSASS